MNVTVGPQRSADTKRALLEQRLRALTTQSGRVPLSFSQQRLWFLDQLQPDSSLYNVASAARVLGPLNTSFLEQAIRTIVKRHQALRTRFEGADGTPVQIIDEDSSITIDVKDLSLLDPQQRAKEEKSIIACEANRPFNLAGERLLRVFLIKQNEQEHVLLIVMHHIISDEWSLKVFFNELASSYTSLVHGDPVTLSSLPIQYSDFAAWQRKWMRGEILEKQLAFWKKQLEGDLPLTELPTDHPRKSVPEFAGSCTSRALPKETTAALKKLAEEEKASLFMVLLAGFKALAARRTHQSDIVIGSPVAGRNRLETEGLIGFFVNTLPLRTNLGGNPSFRECVQRVRQMTLEAFTHQDLPFDRLVEKLRPERSLSHMPFTRLMFTLQAEVMEDLQLDGARLRFEDVETQTAKFDLTIVAQETSHGLIIKAEYDTSLFEKSSIERLLEGYEILLNAGTTSPGTLLADLPVMGANDLALVLDTWSGVGNADVPSKCIHQYFEAEAEKNPRAIAIIFGERRLTYAELNSRANQVAHYLRQLGVRQDVPVAICTRRSIELIVGVLGILKAGGAYVPLDPSYPRERLEFMLSDTQAPVLLSEQCLIAELPKSSARVICLDSDWELLAREPRQNPANLSNPDSLAYIMFTSGSTGIPKGVCIPHQAVCRLVLGTNYIQLTPSDRVAQVSNASFDAATFEIWGALLNGAQLIKIGKDLALSPPEFALELRRRKISALFLTTALFNQLAHDAPHALATVKTVMFGGEAADPRSVRAIVEGGKPQRLVNVYGPTENTTFSTWHEVGEISPEATNIPVGIPITNTQAYILDANFRPVPIGVPGELFLGGPGLARGYWNRQDLTNSCFVAVSFREKAAVRLYRTGDLVRWLPSGIIEFVGRKDNQVKIRGFRVEPGEIEALLAQHPGVRECAVMLQGSNSATRRLVAYTVAVGGSPINATDLRNYLEEKLPDYMVPSTFVMLEALPLTPNGKVDRKSLPAPDQARPDLEGSYAAPTDIIERKLVKIWESVLNVKPIGVHDKFFELGGHSLLAVRLVAKIEKVFGRKLRLATIFQAPTIAQLAAVLREDVRESSLMSKTSLVEIQAHGTRPPLFLVHGAGGGMFWGYVNLAKHLGTDQPVYGFRSRGLDGLPEFDSIEALAAQYVKDLRAFQPHGPYHLGGYCFGGNVAFEMAQQLKSSGEEVALLALINAAPANSKYLKIPWTPVWAARFVGNLFYWIRYFLSWSWPQRTEFFVWKWSVFKRRISGMFKKMGAEPGDSYKGSVDPGNLVDLSSYSADQRKVWEAHIQALIKFHPRPYSGQVHLFRSGGHPLWCSFEPDYGWGEFVTGSVRVIKVPGAHERVLEDECAGTLAARLNSVLSQSQPNNASSLALPAAAAVGGVALAGLACVGAEFLESLWQGLAVLGSSIVGGSAARRKLHKGTENNLSDADLSTLRTWNRTQTSFNVTNSFITHFRRQAAKSAGAPALRYKNETLSYQQLDQRSSQLALRLDQAGVGPGMLVGFCLSRSADTVVAMLAIWKCGAAYLPLDPSYPKERLEYMLQDSGAKVLLIHSEYANHFDTARIQTIVLDKPEEKALIAKLPKEMVVRDYPSDSLAYVIYTSGSTGKPKGVEILHRSLLNHNFGVSEIYKLASTDRVVQFSPVSFDISVEEIFPTLLKGGLLVVRTEEVISSVSEFLKFVDEEKITVLNLPTAYWHEIVEQLREASLPESVRLVVIGGEKASDEAYKQWKARVDQKKVAFINSYGPTETTVTASYYIAPEDADCLAIGKPLPNIQFAVLDEQLRRVAAGETGELFIGGASLARGYLARPELTAERFIENPFTDIDSDRLYRTGDLVRFRPDGNLDFIGRADQQVKVRGFRIELGEIENTLRTHPELKDSAVLAREVRPGHKKLVAYVVPRNGEQPHISEMLKHLRERLPAFMIPATFVAMEAFPLTPAGKIDRLALPAPGAKRPELDQSYVPGRTPVEAMLASIFSEVLEIDRVGVLDNFFDLGGHSLVATQVIARVRDTFHTDVSLAEIFSLTCVAALAERIEQLSNGKLGFMPSLIPGIRAAALSPAQERIWFLDQFDPALSPYNLPIGIHLTGPLDLPALERSLGKLAEMHEALRSFYPEEGGKPVCLVMPAGPVALKYLDISNEDEPLKSGMSVAFAAQEMAKPYLTTRQVFCPALVKLTPTTHDLYIGFHEIAVDHKTAQKLIQKLSALYESEVNGVAASIPVFSEEDSLAAPNNVEQCESFWRDKLKGQPLLLDLPKDHPRPSHKSDAGSCLTVNVPRSITRHLRDDDSAEVAFLTALQLLLSRYTGATDIVVGMPVSRGSNESSLGSFEDYLVLRQNLAGASNFSEVEQETRATLNEALANSPTPFDRVVELVDPPRNSSYTPVFQVLYRFDRSPSLHTCAAGLSFAQFDCDNRTSKFDLSAAVRKDGRDYKLSFRYSTALFEEQRIHNMAQHFCTMLRGALEHPDMPVSKLPLMGEQEWEQVLAVWNRTERPYASHKILVQLFEEQARRSPNRSALISGQRQLTYQELLDNSARVAKKLRALGVGTGGKVALCMERSWELVSAILGILRTGAAYLPVDPLYPHDRVEFMLSDAEVSAVITQKKFQHLFAGTAGTAVWIEDLDWNAPVPEIPTSNGTPADVAYIIYTSGSTGRPKGVLIENRNAVAFMHWARDTFDTEELSGVLASTSVCFDLSIFEIFAPLCWGGRIVLAENALSLPALPAFKEVRLVNTVPSAIRELIHLKGIPETVRTVNLAGEPLAQSLVDEIYGGTSVKRVMDLYGPTETTTYSTGALRVKGGTATIGRPLANEQVYLFDASMEPVPTGIPGELYIGGAGVARGYLNRPELTAEKFIVNPLQPGERLYRTGDLARWRYDGNLEYLGRIDHQVKIRGFRIEPGEIEAALRKHPHVRDVLVAAREDKSGEKKLVAYVAGDPLQLSAADLQAHLGPRVPHYMVPSAFVVLEALPLTPNGKIDRKALPAPELKRDDGVKFIAARNELESNLVGIWKSVLPVNEISITDNFFQLGGHSLLAIRIVARIRESLKLQLPLFSIFEWPTIEALAKQITSGEWAPSESAEHPLQAVRRDTAPPASFVQERLWFLDQLNPCSDAYNVPAALRIKGALDIARLETALNNVIARHEALRTTLRLEDSGLVQVVAPSLRLALAVRDLQEHALAKALSQSAEAPFDLAKGPLLRAELFRLGSEEHVLLITMHHAISDGWSLTILFRDLEAFYSDIEEPSDLPIQYPDYAHWQQQVMAETNLTKELTFWKETLRGAPETIKFPENADRHIRSQKVARATMEFSSDFLSAMSQLGQEKGTTPFMILLAGLAVTLSKWTGQHDLVIGTVVAGRGRRELENLIGCFMNFLPIRLQMPREGTGSDCIAHVKDVMLQAQAHQECPFEKIVSAINPARTKDSNPLYNVALLWQNFPHDLFNGEGLETSTVPVFTSSALLDLRFEADQQGPNVSLICEYREGQFAPETIASLLENIRQVVGELVSSPTKKIAEFGFSSPIRAEEATTMESEAKHKIAITGTFTTEPLADSIKYWTKELGLDFAPEFAGYNQVFQELLDPSSLLGANKDGLNVTLIRFEDWIKSGAVIDTGAKGDILRNIQEMIDALRSFSQRSTAPHIICVCPPSRKMALDAAWAGFLHDQEEHLRNQIGGMSGIYILSTREIMNWYPVEDYYDASSEELGHIPYTPLFYTALGTAIMRKFQALRRPPSKVIVLDCDNTLWSGVCGEEGAKGVRLDRPWKALQDFMIAQHEAGMLLALCSKNNPEDVEEVFARNAHFPLSRNHFAAVRLNWQPKSENLRAIARELNLGLESLIFIDDNPVECAEVEANCPDVVTLLLPETPEDFPKFLAHSWVFDHQTITAEDKLRAESYRQNRERELLRSQSSGLAEFIAGLDLRIEIDPMTPASLARVSQLTQRTNQFNLTTRRRSEQELKNLQGHTILTVRVSDRFGDYGIVGVLISTSLMDSLDVDTFLLSCRVLGRGVEHAMLSRLGRLARESNLARVDLHFTPSPKNKPALSFLENVAAEFKQPGSGELLFRLPAGFAQDIAFNPAAVSQPEQAVRNNGKMNSETTAANYSRVPYRNIAVTSSNIEAIHSRIESGLTQSAGTVRGPSPESELERTIANVWTKLLRRQDISVTDSFFDLGGHSLMAVRLFAELERLTGHKLPLVTLFQAPTIRDLANILEQTRSEKHSGPSLLVPVQPLGNLPPLFLIHGAGGDVLWGYANLAAHLPIDRPVYGIKSRGQIGLDECKTIQEMAAHYVEAVQERQPHGPYYLGGYCFGGNVAYEMARILRDKGEVVELVALLDSSPSNAGYEDVRWWTPTFAWRFARNTMYWLKDFSQMPRVEQIRFITRKARVFMRKIKDAFRKEKRQESFDLEQIIDLGHFPDHELKLWQTHIQALVDHIEQPYDGRVVLFRTRGQPILCSFEEDFCWGRLARQGVQIVRVPGSHENIFMEPNVKVLARELARHLPQAEQRVAEREALAA